MNRKKLRNFWRIWAIILVCCVLLLCFFNDNDTLLMIGVFVSIIEFIAMIVLSVNGSILEDNEIQDSIIKEIVDLNGSNQFEYIAIKLPKYGIAIPKSKEGIIISIKKNKKSFETSFIPKESITKYFIVDKFKEQITTVREPSFKGAAAGAMVGGVVGAVVGARLFSKSESISENVSSGAFLIIHHDPLSPSVILEYESSAHAIETYNAIDKIFT